MPVRITTTSIATRSFHVVLIEFFVWKKCRRSRFITVTNRSVWRVPTVLLCSRPAAAPAAVPGTLEETALARRPFPRPGSRPGESPRTHRPSTGATGRDSERPWQSRPGPDPPAGGRDLPPAPRRDDGRGETIPARKGA